MDLHENQVPEAKRSVPILANVWWGNGGHRRVRTIRLAVGADTSPSLEPVPVSICIYHGVLVHTCILHQRVYRPADGEYIGPTDSYSNPAAPSAIPTYTTILEPCCIHEYHQLRRRRRPPGPNRRPLISSRGNPQPVTVFTHM